LGDDWIAGERAIRSVCDRQRGVGSDGIIVVESRDDGVFRLRGYNPDGSEFERSGNGLRVFAAAMWDDGSVGDERFEAELGGDRVWLQVQGALEHGGRTVAAWMGRASLSSAAVGLDETYLDSGGRLRLGETESVRCQVVSVGNPHCVVFDEELTEASLRRWGPRITAHDGFSAGVNVQLVAPVGPNSIRILIWERGVGHTTASGTSACASAAASVASGLVAPGQVTVVMEGGEFQVAVSENFDLVLRGPIQGVCRGAMIGAFVATL